MRAPDSDERQLAIFLLEHMHTADASQRAMFLRVVNAPQVEEADLGEVKQLAERFTQQRRRT